MNMVLKNSSMIITIGSGNIENVFELDGNLHIGRKHNVVSHEFFGGSCINYTMRLISMGESVYPIPFIGKDKSGVLIQGKISELARKYNTPSQINEFIDSENFLIPSIETPKATILVHQGQRTIFSQGIPQMGKSYNHIEERISTLKTVLPKAGSVMIGHVSPDCAIQTPGKITKKIIDEFSDNHFVFANFGNSQLIHGINFWRADLNRTDILQLNLDEMRRFFQASSMDYSLMNIIKWLKENCITAVITLNRLGAIGTYRDGRDGIIIAWPITIPEIIDPTGAGDAFAAGLVSFLDGNKKFSFDDFLSAIEIGGYWASFACRSLGACAECPDKETLDLYIENELGAHQSKIMKMFDRDYPEQILNLIDKAY